MDTSVVMESLELDVACGHCGWRETRSLSWLSERRDMNCPTCTGVIVLNTSERRKEIAALRRQVLSLRRQLEEAIPAAGCFMTRTSNSAHAAPPAPKFELSLVDVYRDGGRRCANARPAVRAAGRSSR